jgi:hypothetical protein
MDEAILQEAIQGLKSQEFTSQKAAIEHLMSSTVLSMPDSIAGFLTQKHFRNTRNSL